MRYALLLALSVAACGDNIKLAPDAGGDPPDAAIEGTCGDLVVEGAEDCDDGNLDPDDGCSPDCALECGDGAVTGGELCDTGIDRGDGACVTEAECDDADPCTSGVFSGDGCQVMCTFAPITAPIDGDLCCPTGRNANTDSDCDPECGNGELEAGELCDGDCPTACNDGELCTTDTLIFANTCQAECTTTDITEIGLDDGCCPSGATSDTDDDCLDSCGDGDLDSGELCDTAIASGAGACPTACDDGDACTIDTLVNSPGCLAECFETARNPGPMDACCPAGSDLSDDPDCPVTCGDGVLSPPEACDDGGTDPGDGCSATCQTEPVAFRFTDLDLKDPHVYGSIIGCNDVTNLDLGGNLRGVNPLLQTNIQEDDDDADTLLDLSITNTFAPLVQTANATTEADLTFPDCTAPMSTTTCTLPAGSEHLLATATNRGSATTCLGTLAGTTSGYSPAVVSSVAPAGGTCYSAPAGTVTFDIGGIPVTLTDAVIAGEWVGNPATGIADGLIRGFMSEAVANTTIIPEGTTNIASIDGEPLSELLPGGVNSCRQPSPMVGDKDTVNGVVGWVFYLNFSAARVTYTEL